MSSYFDRAEHMFELAMRKGDERAAQRIATVAFDKYERYLQYVFAHAYKSDHALVESFITRFKVLQSRPYVDDMARATHLCFALADLHNLAHAFGSARIGMRGKTGVALDNPYWPSMQQDEIERWTYGQPIG